MVDVKTRLENSQRNLKEWKQHLVDNKSELKEYFDAFYMRHYMYYSNEHRPLGRDDFEVLIEKGHIYIDNQIDFIDKLLALDIVCHNKLSKQMKSLLSSCVADMHYELIGKFTNELIFDFQHKKDYSEEYASILILSRFSEIDSNIILIGGNGSGKSTLANRVKGSDTENISVIPAQKTLYFSLRDSEMLSIRVPDLLELLLENNIGRSKENDDYGYFEYQNNQFTKLIVAMREEYVTYLMECEENGFPTCENDTIFGKLRYIFSIIFPNIKLRFGQEKQNYLCCEKDGHVYHVNALSEGEKAVIYYSISVLMAQKDSFIVVDEPETYLNPSLVNLLWDTLIQLRSDSQFIFITHSVNFVMGRSDSKVAWIKKFTYPKYWEFDFVEDNFLLPKPMITEVLGTSKCVIFCEGNDKTSCDYTIYRALFGEQYTVIPVEGHLDVIKSCDVVSSSKWMGRDCIGFVDGDNFTCEKKESLRGKNVLVLPFNEIEMLLLCDEVMDSTIGASLPLEKEQKICAFKAKFWELVERKKEKIALDWTKKQVDEYLAKEKLESYNNVEAIKHNLKRISEYDVESIYCQKVNAIETIIAKNDYESLLLICNLKKEVSRGLANSYLDNDYEQKAIQQIIVNKALQEKLKERYFDGLGELLNMVAIENRENNAKSFSNEKKV